MIGIAADQMTTEFLLCGTQPLRKGGHPGALRRPWERQCQHIGSRIGALGGKIRHVHGECLPGDVFGFVARKEMHAFNDRIIGDDEIGTGFDGKKCGIVGQAESSRDLARQRCEIRLDQLGLAFDATAHDNHLEPALAGMI